jgi:NADPH:quinone reductase-like Zn-dependent oxidoreductase
MMCSGAPGSPTGQGPGAEVAAGSCAEYASAAGNLLVRKPANLTFEQAAAVPLAAMTALQALRDAGRLQPGQKVLVNGTSGASARSPCRSPGRPALR